MHTYTGSLRHRRAGGQLHSIALFSDPNKRSPSPPSSSAATRRRRRRGRRSAPTRTRKTTAARSTAARARGARRTTLHALCFDATNLPTTGWSCDTANPRPPTCAPTAASAAPAVGAVSAVLRGRRVQARADGALEHLPAEGAVGGDAEVAAARDLPPCARPQPPRGSSMEPPARRLPQVQRLRRDSEHVLRPDVRRADGQRRRHRGCSGWRARWRCTR